MSCESFLQCPIGLILPVIFFGMIGFTAWMYIKKDGILERMNQDYEDI